MTWHNTNVAEDMVSVDVMSSMCGDDVHDGRSSWLMQTQSAHVSNA